MKFLVETISFLCSDCLFSAIVTVYALLFLYTPCCFLQFVFSPVVLTTLVLLLHLLRFGAAQNSSGNGNDQNVPEPVSESEGLGFELRSGYGSEPSRLYEESFVEWDVRAPLEVIYEEPDEENDGVSGMSVIQRYASLSRYYPESDGDSSSSSEGGFSEDGDGDSPRNICFRWEDDEEDDREGLIEIALDEKRNDDVDEENLIEIDLSPPASFGLGFRRVNRSFGIGTCGDGWMDDKWRSCC